MRVFIFGQVVSRVPQLSTITSVSIISFVRFAPDDFILSGSVSFLHNLIFGNSWQLLLAIYGRQLILVFVLTAISI